MTRITFTYKYKFFISNPKNQNVQTSKLSASQPLTAFTRQSAALLPPRVDDATMTTRKSQQGRRRLPHLQPPVEQHQ
ncbi:hypothetical protein Scep_014392 [Stephania cephalantha]|uniref:Uncharacterized protein n=1 Tax=Stephania cephalantha TaxID=152367 RepID=A0AAP0P2Z1_9MAGN